MPKSLADKLLPKRMRDEIERILDASSSQRANPKHGVVSIASRRERRLAIRLAFAQLWEMGYRLKTCRSLGGRHVRALVERWDREGLAAGTLHTRLSYLSIFASWIGKRGMVGCLTDYCQKDRVTRKHIAERNKSWQANGMSPEQVIELAKDFDERLALYLTLQHTLGLRVKESLEFRPLVALADDGVTLEVFEGTKGGRRRTVRLETDAQRQAYSWASEVARQTRGGRVRWPGLTFKQAQRKFYSLMEHKLKITRRDSGVTAHGLRHGFAQDHYHRRTGGLPTPIEGGAIGAIDRRTHAEASMSTSKALGHSRLAITASYYGSYGHGLRQVVATVQPMNLNLKPIVPYA